MPGANYRAGSGAGAGARRPRGARDREEDGGGLEPAAVARDLLRGESMGQGGLGRGRRFPGGALSLQRRCR